MCQMFNGSMFTALKHLCENVFVSTYQTVRRVKSLELLSFSLSINLLIIFSVKRLQIWFTKCWKVATNAHHNFLKSVNRKFCQKFVRRNPKMCNLRSRKRKKSSKSLHLRSLQTYRVSLLRETTSVALGHWLCAKCGSIIVWSPKSVRQRQGRCVFQKHLLK